MAGEAVSSGWILTIPEKLYAQLSAHLFPGDGDEHSAVLLAGVQRRPDGTVRMLARNLVLARDGVDYVAGQHGYRMLLAQFFQPYALQARDEELTYLAIHNHGGRGHVAFSGDDLASHLRGYPALLTLTRQPVGALVFAEGAVAGKLYSMDGSVRELASCTVVGKNRIELMPTMREIIDRDPTRARQALLLGDLGVVQLATMRVGVIGWFDSC